MWRSWQHKEIIGDSIINHSIIRKPPLIQRHCRARDKSFKKLLVLRCPTCSQISMQGLTETDNNEQLQQIKREQKADAQRKNELRKQQALELLAQRDSLYAAAMKIMAEELAALPAIEPIIAKSIDIMFPNMPATTENYVPKLQLYREVVQHKLLQTIERNMLQRIEEEGLLRYQRNRSSRTNLLKSET